MQGHNTFCHLGSASADVVAFAVGFAFVFVFLFVVANLQVGPPSSLVSAAFRGGFSLPGFYGAVL